MSIKNTDGKLRSERSAEEVADVLIKEINSLSPQEREVLQIMMNELDDPAFRSPADAQENGGPTRLYDILAANEYRHRPVDIKTFVTDEYFLGNTCSGLYAKLQDDMEELFNGGYKEAILSGSIGWGKTFFASIAVCRCLYEISCLKDPHRSFGIAPGSNIAFVAFSITENLASKVVFENIATKIEASPYFQEHFPFKQTKKDMEFPNHVWVAARAANMGAALGLNVMGFIIDETNFMKAPTKTTGNVSSDGAGSADTAQLIYDQMVRRMKSRFQRRGKLPGMAIVVSSKKTKDDFTAKRIRESKDDPDIFVRDYATWDVAPIDRFSTERFQVLVGNEATPSKILLPEEVKAIKEKIGDTGMLILDIPQDFYKDFENDLEGSIRDIAGAETVAISPFIHNREALITCIDTGRHHPFNMTEWDQSKGGAFEWTKLSHMTQVRDGAHVYQAWQPLWHPELPRHIHIDPSINTDFTGIAMGTVLGHKHVERFNAESNERYLEAAPIIWVDFMLRIVPPVGGEIDHGMIRRIVYELQAHGFHISKITMDQFNSAPTMQKFRTKGIACELLSVDKPMDAYQTLKAALYESRVSYYDYVPLLEELRTIQHDRTKNKVDHPARVGNRRGSKDVADALAGITYSLTTDYRGSPMGIVKGISTHSDPLVEENKRATDPEEPWFPFIRG